MAPFNGTGEMPRTLVIGSIGPRMEAELIAVGIPAGTVDGGAQAVALLRNGDYDVVVVPTDLTDMSAFDFATSLLRHIPDVFVILWGGMMEPDKLEGLRQSGRVVHFRGDEDGSVAIWVMEKASGQNPADPGEDGGPETIVGSPELNSADPGTPAASLSAFGAPPAASPFGGAPAASPFGGAPAAAASPFGGTPAASPFGGAPAAGASPFGAASPLDGEPAADTARAQQLEEDLGLAHAELEEAQARLQQADAATQAAGAEARGAIEQLQEERAQHAEGAGQIDDLQKSLNSAQEFLKTVSQERDGLKALVLSLEDERSGQESGAASVQADLEELRRHLLAVQAELVEARQGGDAGRAEAAALAAVVAERESALTATQAELAAAQAEQVAAQTARGSAQTELAAAHGAAEALLAELAAAQTQLAGGASNEAVLAAALAEAAAARTATSAAEARISEQEGTLTALQGVVGQRELQVAELAAKLAEGAAPLTEEDPVRVLLAGIKPEIALEAAAFLEITGEGEEHVERLREFAALLGVLLSTAKTPP